ncbi:hypothetical protein V2J09_002524 [Rumex salicifolius]
MALTLPTYNPLNCTSSPSSKSSQNPTESKIGRMGFGSLRNLVRPLCRVVSSRTAAAAANNTITNLAPLRSISPLSNHFYQNTPQFLSIFRSVHLESLASIAPRPFDALTDTRLPKRRHSDKHKRKRASLKPPGPYAWVNHVPGEPVLPSQPNEGSVKLRNEKKRRRQRREFILAEKKKRKAQLQEANRKKREKRIERKMAQVAREREWVQRLAELQQLEKEKKTLA